MGGVSIIQAENAQACVDPRRPLTPEEIYKLGLEEHGVKRNSYTPGAIHSPGGSFGIMMSLYAASGSLTPQETVDLEVAWETTGVSGCGHRDRASDEENEQLYGIAASVTRDISDYVKRDTRITRRWGRSNALLKSIFKPMHSVEVIFFRHYF